MTHEPKRLSKSILFLVFLLFVTFPLGFARLGLLLTIAALLVSPSFSSGDCGGCWPRLPPPPPSLSTPSSSPCAGRGFFSLFLLSLNLCCDEDEARFTSASRYICSTGASSCYYSQPTLQASRTGRRCVILLALRSKENFLRSRDTISPENPFLPPPSLHSGKKNA